MPKHRPENEKVTRPRKEKVKKLWTIESRWRRLWWGKGAAVPGEWGEWRVHGRYKTKKAAEGAYRALTSHNSIWTEHRQIRRGYELLS